MDGWIKLHRSALDHWLYTEYRPLTRREAWETILFTVNFEPSKSLIRGQLYECGRGQSLLSLQSWAEKFVWSVKQVRTFFSLLEKDGMIITEGLQYTTRLTVCKYDYYQGEGQTEGTPAADEGQTEGTPAASHGQQLKKEKKEKNNKEGKEDIVVDSHTTKFIKPTIQEVTEYCQSRKNLVSPSTWLSYYESNGWKVGKNQMKDWRACIRHWEGNGFSKTAFSKDDPYMTKQTEKFIDHAPNINF